MLKDQAIKERDEVIKEIKEIRQRYCNILGKEKYQESMM